MKKNNIFRHELNESIQADAAMNCLRNRNKHKQINEVAPVVASAGRMLLPMLRPVITKLVQKALVKIGTHARPTEVLKLVMGMLTKGEFAKKMAEKCGQTWNEIPSDVKKEIQNAIIDAFKAQSPQEQEETTDEKGAFALKLVKKFKNRMTPDYAKRPEMFMMLKLQKALKKPLMSLSKEEYRAWAKAICDACEAVFGSVQEQEESTYNEKEAIAKQLMANYNPDTDELEDPTAWLLCAIQERIGKLFLKMPKKEVNVWKKVIDSAITEYEFEKQHPAHYEHPEDEARLQSQLANAWDEGMEDDEDDYVPYENKFDETHHDIVDSILDEVDRYFQFETDVEGFNLYEYTEEQVGKAIEQILDKTGDFPSSVNNNVCYAWVKKHAEEIIKALENGSLENSYEGHPEFDFSEQEENSLDTEYFSDLEEQEAYYENFRAIAELVADQIDRENGKYIDNNMDTLFTIIREIWNNNPDDLYIWDFDDVQENDCYKFFDKYYETIKNEYLKREHNNIMAATHDDLFDGMMNN